MDMTIFKKKKKKSKYKNQRVTCLSRHVHDSKFEADYCNKLLAMKSSGEIKDFEIQKKFDLHVHNVHICSHIVDFVVFIKSDDAEVHEVKGFRTDDWQIKRKLFCAIYPTIKYVTISRR